MTTITLPPDIEGPLTEAARRLGTTPELLALDSLRRLFASAKATDKSADGETLFDFLSDAIGAVSGATEALSENCGRRFAEGMVEKHSQSRL